MIEPALTAADWASRAVSFTSDGAPVTVSTWGDGLKISQANARGLTTVVLPQAILPAIIALANAQLPTSDRRKITLFTIAALTDPPDDQDLGDIADALESYLPPTRI